MGYELADMENLMQTCE